MLFRSLFDFLFATPVTTVMTVVSLLCVSVLVVNISANNADLSNTGGVDVNFNKTDLSTPFSAREDGGLQAVSQSSAQAAGKDESGSNKNNKTKNNKSNQNNNNDSYNRDQSYIEDYAGDANRSDRPSIFNYSNTGNSSNINTTSSTTSSTTTTTTSDPEDNLETGNPDTLIPDNNFPSSLENKVKTDEDTEHSISCSPIESGGRPCMCTYTIEDANGITSWVEDNCG